MRFWDRHRKPITGLGVASLAVAAGWFTVVRGTTEAAAAKRSEYDAHARKIAERRTGSYDLEDVRANLARSNEKAAMDVRSIQEQVRISFHDWADTIPPDYANDPGHYFRVMLANQQTNLHIKCQSMERPVRLAGAAGDLGFPRGGAIDDASAPMDLKRLSMATHVVTLLAESGVSEILDVSHKPAVQTGAPGMTAFIWEYPVSVSVRTTLDALMTFLHAVRQPGRLFLVVRGLDISAGDALAGDDLTVSLDAAGMAFMREDERAGRVAPRPGQPKPQEKPVPSGPPLGH